MKEKGFNVVFIRQYTWIAFLLGIFVPVSVNAEEEITTSLSKAGFENVRVHEENLSVYVSFENTIYRWNVNGIMVALDSISAHAEPEQDMYVVVLALGVPQVVIQTKVGRWTEFRKQVISPSEFSEEFQVSYNTSPAWKKINHQESSSASYGKLDLILYPQVRLSNTYFDRFFDTQVNIAPTLDLSLWKGAKGTLQYIFPITNSARVFGKEGRWVRPGFATISQQFRFNPKLYTNITGGLFSNYRSGVDVEGTYHLSNSISLQAEAGYTGYVNIGGYLPSDWTFTTWDQLTWSAGGYYFNKALSLQVSSYAKRFLTGDTGLRMDITRFFGEVAIGFYGVITEDDKNAGFHIAIPLPGKKRPHWERFRIMLPKYFDWEYAVTSNNISGASFEVRPNENPVESFFNPVYLKSQILKN